MEFWPETKVKQRSKMHHDWSRSYSGGNLAEEVESHHLSGNFDRGDCKEKQDSSRPLMTWNSFKHIHNSTKQHICKRKHKLSRRQTGSASLQTEFDRRSDITEHVQNHSSALFNSFSQGKKNQPTIKTGWEANCCPVSLRVDDNTFH